MIGTRFRVGDRVRMRYPTVPFGALRNGTILRVFYTAKPYELYDVLFEGEHAPRILIAERLIMAASSSS